MAMQRNIISEYEARIRTQISVWLADGCGPKAIKARLANLGVTPLPHNSSFIAYRKSAEYKRIYDRQLEIGKDVAAAETDWKIAEQAGANGYAATAVFTTLRDLKQQYADAEDLTAKIRIAETINTIARTFGGNETERLKEADRAWKRRLKEQEIARSAEIDRLKSAHAEEIAAKDAEIAKLQERCSVLEVAMQKKSVVVDPNQRAAALAAVDEFVGKPQR